MLPHVDEHEVLSRLQQRTMICERPLVQPGWSALTNGMSARSSPAAMQYPGAVVLPPARVVAPPCTQYAKGGGEGEGEEGAEANS